VTKDSNEQLRDDLVKAAGTHLRAAAVLRVLADVTGSIGVVWSTPTLRMMADAIEEADEVRDPLAGDSVILRGQITELVPDLGVAFVRVYRPGLLDQREWIVMQVGALERDTAAALYDGGVPG
jgi:hypothetical protein